MDEHDRRETLKNFNPAEIDPEFLPYLERINNLPHVASHQCCAGHISYETGKPDPQSPSGCWGYLGLIMDWDLAEWLNERIIRDFDWLLADNSQYWGEHAGKAPGVTENNSYVLTLAWDASAWPLPAEEICEALEEYHKLHLDADDLDEEAP